MTSKPVTRLFVSDIDNTLFDWVAYYVHAFSALLKSVESTIGAPYATLAAEAKEVFAAHGSIEFPFVVQELPSVMSYYGDDIDRMLSEAVAPARDLFLAAAEPYLKPYEGVIEVLKEIRARNPGVPLVALTDAPRYVAMWKMNKLGLLAHFDAVYGLGDPRIPTTAGRVKVDPKLLLKHLQQNNFGFAGRIRILPDDYEKPGTKGLKTVLMDYEMDESVSLRASVLWVGDNERKDINLGKRLGVRTAWASYGKPEAALLARLSEFSPMQNIHKNASLGPGETGQVQPDMVLATFADILPHV